MQKVHFHRNGNVSIGGKIVGTFQHPDPSGAAHARSLIWLFTAFDGKQQQARRRGWLDDAANSAFIRLSRAA